MHWKLGCKQTYGRFQTFVQTEQRYIQTSILMNRLLISRLKSIDRELGFDIGSSYAFDIARCTIHTIRRFL